MNNIQAQASIGEPLYYEGSVKVSLNKNGKVYSIPFRNSGTKYFLDTIAKALAGYDIKDRIPYKFDIVDATHSKIVSYTKQEVRVTSIYGDASGRATESTSALFLTGALTNADKRPIETLTNASLVVMTKDNNILAQVTSDDLQQLWDSVTVASEAIIEWTMVFSNKSE